MLMIFMSSQTKHIWKIEDFSKYANKTLEVKGFKFLIDCQGMWLTFEVGLLFLVDCRLNLKLSERKTDNVNKTNRHFLVLGRDCSGIAQGFLPSAVGGVSSLLLLSFFSTILLSSFSLYFSFSRPSLFILSIFLLFSLCFSPFDSFLYYFFFLPFFSLYVSLSTANFLCLSLLLCFSYFFFFFLFFIYYFF